MKTGEEKDGLNDRQRVFCREVAKGTPRGKAYAIAYGCKKVTDACRANASRLIANDNIKGEIERLRQIDDEEMIADKREIMRYLTRVLRTPIEDICGNDNSDLVHSITFGPSGKTYKMVGKMDALREISKMRGFYEPEKHEHVLTASQEFCEALKGINAPVVPTDLM